MGSERIVVCGVPCVRWKSNAEPSKGSVVYLHGGGLVYGSPYDYPATSLKRFLDAGFDFVSIGYPLAPEVPLDGIIDVTFDCLTELMNRGIIDVQRYFAFGRSAGVFLWMAVLARLVEKRIGLPRAILALYGYASLEYFNLSRADEGHRCDVRVDETTAFGLIESTPVHDDSLMSRVLLYIFARQHGLLAKLLGISDTALSAYSFEEELRGNLPPTFAAWSLRDPEVDPAASRALCSLASESECFTVDAACHDFDQNTELDETKRLMDAMIRWLSRQAELDD